MAEKGERSFYPQDFQVSDLQSLLAASVKERLLPHQRAALGGVLMTLEKHALGELDLELTRRIGLDKLLPLEGLKPGTPFIITSSRNMGKTAAQDFLSSQEIEDLISNLKSLHEPPEVTERYVHRQEKPPVPGTRRERMRLKISKPRPPGKASSLILNMSNSFKVR